MSDGTKPIGIVPDDVYAGMYRLIWADEIKSKDFYNLTMTKDNLKFYSDKRDRMKNKRPRHGAEKAVDAFK
jgi:hypothetical protein